MFSVIIILYLDKIPFVIGGGNDQSFPNGHALLKHYKGYLLSFYYYYSCSNY